MSELVLVKRIKFNGMLLDCYIKPEQEDEEDYLLTSEQIGRLLGYEHPQEAIEDIHKRNSPRLEKFSQEAKIMTSSGMQKTRVYNFKGLLEICRHSKQQEAHDVWDWLTDAAEQVITTGSYSLEDE